MDNEIDGPRNIPRVGSDRVHTPAPTWLDRRQARSPNWSKPRSSLHSPGIENSRVLTKRARAHEIDGVIGAGHPEMSAEEITRGLTRIARKPPRTSKVLEIGGFPFALCPHIPAGVWAFRTATGVNAFSMETGSLIIVVPHVAPGHSELAASNP